MPLNTKKSFWIVSITLVLFINIPASVFPNGFLNYLAHCNLSMGPNFKFGSENIEGNDLTAMYFYDNLGNTYLFYFDASVIKNKMLGPAINVRFPFYYNDSFTIGLNTEVNGLEDIGQISLGIYFNWMFNERWSITSDAGCALSIYDKVIGTVFEKDIKVSALGPSFTGSLGIKFHIFEYLYLEAGYRFIYASKLNSYTVYYNDENIGEPDLTPISINHNYNFSIKIGVGI